MSVSFRFCNSPGAEFHFRALEIDCTTDFVLHTNDDLIETVRQPFEAETSATVFHVHEVMRIVLSQLDLTDREGFMMAHSNKIRSEFERLSYHAASVWSDWGSAVDDAGGAISTILQRMFGVRIRQNGWWIPHLEYKYIEVNDDWSIIDDVVTTTDLLELASSEDLWISMDTGLRLFRNTVKSDECSESLSHFFGKNHRFSSASAWLQWSLENGTRQELPVDQGTVHYYKGIVNSEIPRYFAGQVREKGPYESDWWTQNVNAPEVPKFDINSKPWAFGMLWKFDEEERYWAATYPHFHPIEGGDIVNISGAGLKLIIKTDAEEIEENELGALNVRRSLSSHIVTEHLRAIRVLLIELGHALPPITTDSRIGGLGLSGSKIPSPFSDMYFLNPKKGPKLGVIIGSPVETTLRREILRNNWYVVE